MSGVVSFENVSKKYRIGLARYHSLREDISYMFKRILSPQRQDDTKNFIWALQDVSFEVKQGESLGIIGPNGAGKTTILKLLSRITLPTKGRVLTKGKLSALIELGAGFHPELTGRENIYLYGSIMGMKTREINKKFDKIVDFAEPGQFIDTPVKKYSSGMRVRLGFAVAAHIDADILLIDEVLAVGDMAFQRKCFNKITELKNKGITIICVSHNMHNIRNVSNNCIWLDRGIIKKHGNVEETIRWYLNYLRTEEMNLEKAKESEDIIEISKIEIKKVNLLDNKREQKNVFQKGEGLTVEISYYANEILNDITFGCAIYRNDGTYVYGTNTLIEGIRFGSIKGEGKIRIKYDPLILLEGIYEISIGIFRKDDWSFPYDYHDRCCRFVIESKDQEEGVVMLPHQWEV